MMDFSLRTHWSFQENALQSMLNDLKKEGAPVLDLTASNPTSAGFDYPADPFMTALVQPSSLDYKPESLGWKTAREAVCCYYQAKGIEVTPDRVLLTASTSEAYAFLFRLLVNPHERVLFPRPSYPLFQFFVELNDLYMDYYPLVYDGVGWPIGFDQMVRVMRSDTRAVVLVNPNNPTGSFIKQDEIDRLNQQCRHQNCAIICDEVFHDYAFDAHEKYPSLAANDDVLTFTLGGLSKTLGLPQMKLSWVLVNGPEEDVRAAMQRLEIIADTYLSVNTPVQQALPRWIAHKDIIQDQIKQRIRQNYTFLCARAEGAKTVQVMKAQGGWYAVLKVPSTRTAEEWALKLLGKYHVHVHPGYFYEFNDEAYLVLSLLPPESEFQEGLLRVFSRVEQESA